jgi:hypothetical protein
MDLVIIIFIILLIIVIVIIKNNKIEGMESVIFLLDTLYIPENPEPINEIVMRTRSRLVGIDTNLKLDTYNRVERILFSEPKPDLGETKCFRVKCPSWLENVYCWKCN